MNEQLANAQVAAKRWFRRFLWWSLIILLLVGIGFFIYSQLTYSDGYKSGQLVKISRKGVVFKTYEGTLNLSPTGMMTAWEFSVVNKAVAQELEKMDGKPVKVHYEQRFQKFFWQGDTEYIVDAVEQVDQ